MRHSGGWIRRTRYRRCCPAMYWPRFSMVYTGFQPSYRYLPGRGFPLCQEKKRCFSAHFLPSCWLLPPALLSLPPGCLPICTVWSIYSFCFWHPCCCNMANVPDMKVCSSLPQTLQPLHCCEKMALFLPLSFLSAFPASGCCPKNIWPCCSCPRRWRKSGGCFMYALS